MKRIIALALLLWAAPAGAESWSTTKKLAASVYAGHRTTLYCECPYNDAGKVRGCDFRPARKWRNRARRIEWEHIVPVSLMGCGTRAGCTELVPEAVFDLHNLAPAVGQVNAYRGNDRYGYAPEVWEGCGAGDDAHTFEPPDEVKGDVARIWLYMRYQHGVPIPPYELAMFYRWSVDDPVDAWERERDRRAHMLQGNRNPFVASQGVCGWRSGE